MLTREKIEAMLAAATPGEWVVRVYNTFGGTRALVVREPSGAPDDNGDMLAEPWHPGDAELMAAAPELARELLKAWEERDTFMRLWQQESDANERMTRMLAGAGRTGGMR